MAKKGTKKRAGSSKPRPAKPDRSCQPSQDRLAAARGAGADPPSDTDGVDDGLRLGEPYFHKGLNHTPEGTVDPTQWADFIDALRVLDSTGDSAPLSSIAFQADNRKWVNPLAGWAVDTEMSGPCFHTIPAPPAHDSVEAAAEAIELYWMALLRDVPFADWNSDANVGEAIEELGDLPLYINREGNVNGPPTGKNSYIRFAGLDTKSLFRGGELFDGSAKEDEPKTKKAKDGAKTKPPTPRENVGPYISQFLLKEIPYGTLRIPQRFIYARPYRDYLTDPAKWREVQNGEPRNPMKNLVGETRASERRYLSTMRDLATYVHFDQLYQAYLDAALILVQGGAKLSPGLPYSERCAPYGGIGLPRSPSPDSPLSQNQDGFGTFGGAHVLSLVTETATRALKAVWRQKWTHLRLRPEAYGGHVTFRSSILGPGEDAMLNSRAVNRVYEKNRNRLLPMAFPEGSPMHPAYGAGHATVAGACVTILKAFFDEGQPIENPVAASTDGRSLEPYENADAGEIKVGVELDKLASNISIGRNMAGVHWRSDYTQSVLLGQRVATDLLFRQCRDYAEPDYCFEFTTFGGGKVHVGHKGVKHGAPGQEPSLILSADDFGLDDRIARREDAEIAERLLKII